MATENDTSPANWSPETLKQLISTQLNTLQSHVDRIFVENELRERQRFEAAQTAITTLRERTSLAATELDRRYEQRFVDIAILTQVHTDQRHALSAEMEKRMESRFLSYEKAVNAALASAQQAVQKAETANEKRFDSVNEFRTTLSDQTATFMPRAEMEARLSSVTDKITDINQRQAVDAGKGSGINQSWVVLLGGIGGLGVLVTILLSLVRLPVSTGPAVAIAPPVVYERGPPYGYERRPAPP